MKTFIFLDAEYYYTVGLSEGKIPDYKTFIDMVKNKYKGTVIFIYFVGSLQKKRGIYNYLIKIGATFVNVIELFKVSKPQIIASTMALDVAKLSREDNVSHFVFLSGNDYLIPIIEHLSKINITSDVYYYPPIFSNALEKTDCKISKLSDKYFMFPKEYIGSKDGNKK